MRQTFTLGRMYDASKREARFFAAAGALRWRAAARPAKAQSGEPIKIGFSMALTGPLAANGKQALLGMKIWEEEINAKGGLLGRPVKLVYYDDQSNPATGAGHLHQAARCRQGRPDHRALRAPTMLAPAMPVVMQRDKVFIGLFGARRERPLQLPTSSSR